MADPAGAATPTLDPDEDRDLDDFRALRTSGDRQLRNRLVERHIGLAVHIAQRFTRGGGVDEDLRQVALLGLVKAVDRFDPAIGTSFSAYAGRTIEGELKRHFRDRSWAVRVPRGAKDLHLAVRTATEELSQQLGRSPTVDEIAAHLGVDRDDVLRGLAATAASQVGSLDHTAADRADERPIDHAAAIGVADAALDRVEDREIVAELIARLPERERRIVALRCFEERSQSEIAAEVGISQMHVSRLLRRSFEQMRAWLDER